MQIAQRAISRLFAIEDGLEKSQVDITRTKDLFIKHFNLTKREDILRILYGADFNKVTFKSSFYYGGCIFIVNLTVRIPFRFLAGLYSLVLSRSCPRLLAFN